MECTICYRNLSPKNVVTCPTCEYKSCSKCLGTFFLEISEPKCPNCSNIWTREFICLHFKSFLSKFHNMRKEFLFQREVALLPSTQKFAEAKQYALKLSDEIKEIHIQRNVLYDQLRMLQVEINKKQQIIDDLLRFQDTTQVAVEKVTILCKCPKDECRGFIMIENCTCGLCSTQICKHCHQVKENDEHTCNSDNIQTVKLLKKDSKPCPKCTALIFKIDGCDQMWCTQCHTAFSWKTGLKVNERVHNPHYYEWQRRINNGEAPRVEDELCNNHYQNWGEINRMLRNYSFFDTVTRRKLESFHRFTGHFLDMFPAPREPNHIAMRVSYLLNEISKEEFCRHLISEDTWYNRNKDMRDLVEVFGMESNNIFRDLQQEMTTVNEAMEKIDTLVEFCNETIDFINKKYRSVNRKRIFFNVSNSQYAFEIHREV